MFQVPPPGSAPSSMSVSYQADSHSCVTFRRRSRQKKAPDHGRKKKAASHETAANRIPCFRVQKSRGRGTRTPVNGFGDRRSTTELFPCVSRDSFCPGHERYYSTRKMSLSSAFCFRLCRRRSWREPRKYWSRRPGQPASAPPWSGWREGSTGQPPSGSSPGRALPWPP